MADWELVIESDLKFALTVNGVALNTDATGQRRSELTNVLTSDWPRNVKETQIGVAAAWCAAVHARTWYDGWIYQQEVVDLLPLRAPEPVGQTTGTGHRIAFELDPQWLPPMSAMTRGLDTHPHVHDQRASVR